MGANQVKIILDTNILISALGFGGKPREILRLVLDKKLKASSSTTLLAELEDIISKKFPKLATDFEKINKQLRKKFKIVRPKVSINILQDEPDNRLLEAALEGNCQYIITGDKELLELRSFKGIRIMTADEFLNIIEKN